MKEFEMPCPCENCGVIFELDEGSEYAGTIYCEECGDNLNDKEEKGRELEDAKESLKDAETDVMYWKTMIANLQKEYDDFD